MSITNVLGVRLDNITQAEIEEKVKKYLQSDSYHWIATINPEIVLHAYNKSSYCWVLNQSDLNIVDGIGLNFVFSIIGKKLKHRYSGVDLIDYLAKIASEKNKKIILYGSQEKFENGKTTARVTADILKEKYANLKIEVESGGDISKLGFKNAAEQIKAYQADIALIALSNPTQEEFVNYFNDIDTGLKIAVGIGGAFNMISGYLKRAPKIMRQLGLEWLWRLFLEPNRLKRIINAVVVFPCIFFFRKIFYRYLDDSVICIMNESYEILLSSRKDDPSHWQMPKGGVKVGESNEAAMFRELEEEMGIKRADISKAFRLPKIHKYHYSREFINTINRDPYQGQKQHLWLLKYVGDKNIKIDNKEFCDYQWVKLGNLFKILHPIRHDAAKKMLKYLDKIS